jgi:hypothetical protein
MATTTATTAQFNVGGILLNQPFKIRRLGHFGFNSTKIDETLPFYTDLLGFRISDEIDFARHLPDRRRSPAWAIRAATSRATAATITRSSSSRSG